MKKCSERFNLLKKLSSNIKGITVRESKGAFYAAIAIDCKILDFESS